MTSTSANSGTLPISSIPSASGSSKSSNTSSGRSARMMCEQVAMVSGHDRDIAGFRERVANVTEHNRVVVDHEDACRFVIFIGTRWVNSVRSAVGDGFCGHWYREGQACTVADAPGSLPRYALHGPQPTPCRW